MEVWAGTAGPVEVPAAHAWLHAAPGAPVLDVWVRAPPGLRPVALVCVMAHKAQTVQEEEEIEEEGERRGNEEEEQRQMLLKINQGEVQEGNEQRR